MGKEAMMLLDLYRRHLRAMRNHDEELRERLFLLIAEFEWAFPEAAEEVNKAYPVKSGDAN